MSAVAPGRVGGLAVLVSLAACVGPRTPVEPAEPRPPVHEVAGRLAEERARTRAQFEAARTGQSHQSNGPHSLFNCPHCVDPMKGIVPDEALVDGPMPVWN